MKKLITLSTITLIALNSFAQDQHLIDSLETKLKSFKAKKIELGKLLPNANDTIAANILYAISRAYWYSDPDKAMDYANQCLALSEQIGFKKGIGNAYNSMGLIESVKGSYLSSLELHKRALKIREEIRDKQGIAGSHNNIGGVYEGQGNYDEALKNFLLALKMNVESGNKPWQIINLNNIANIYREFGNYAEALKNSFIVLKIAEEIGTEIGVSGAYNGIGIVYLSQGNYPEALKYFLACLKMCEETGRKIGIASSYNSIGVVFCKMGNYSEAIKNFFTSLNEAEKLGAKDEIANACNGIGEMYIYEKKYKEASLYLNKALKIGKEIGSLESIIDSYNSIKILDSTQGNFKQAFEHHKLFITYRDSFVNTESTKKVLALQMNYEYDKKQDSLNAVQVKKDLMASNEKNKQLLLRNGFIGGFGVMLLFAGIFFMQRNKIRKGKQKSDELLLNILPSEVAEELKDTGSSKAKSFDEATVMFTDFKNFTNISEKMSAEELVKDIDACFTAFDHIIHKHGIEKIKTIGDAYMCAGGLPIPNNSHAADVVKAALEVRDFMTNYNKEKVANGEFPFEIRIGINTGAVVAGIVGVRKFAYDIWGDTVNLASRMESHGEAGKVNISGSTYQLVKDNFTCTHRGKIMTKSKGEVDMYFVEEQI